MGEFSVNHCKSCACKKDYEKLFHLYILILNLNNSYSFDVVSLFLLHKIMLPLS